MGADACAPTYFARGPLAVMLAYLQSATLLALDLFTLVGTDACALALALDTRVWANACAPAYLALAPLAIMLAYLPAATLLALSLFTLASGGRYLIPHTLCTDFVGNYGGIYGMSNFFTKY